MPKYFTQCQADRFLLNIIFLSVKTGTFFLGEKEVKEIRRTLLISLVQMSPD
jgi:hypothetical protein